MPDTDSSLHNAASVGDVQEIRCMLDHGADVDSRESKAGSTALHIAAGNGQVEVMTLLLSRGADINARTLSGATPLHWAVKGMEPAAVKLLVARGANVNVRDASSWTPLHCAASSGAAEIVRLLVSAGADVSARDDHGWTAHDVAREAPAYHKRAAGLMGLRDDADRDARAEEVLRILNRPREQENPAQPPSQPQQGGTTRMHRSDYAHRLRCEHCHEYHGTDRWPTKGDHIPFYYQKEPGNFSLVVTCPNCRRDWYVVWDSDPGQILPLDSVRERKRVHSAQAISRDIRFEESGEASSPCCWNCANFSVALSGTHWCNEDMIEVDRGDLCPHWRHRR
jgi:hypothetical protein